MSYIIPEPHKVRALRIPADGSDPHLITLETLITEDIIYPQSTTYDALLSHLEKQEKARHVPNVIVFWGATGWENRAYTWSFYEDEAMESLEGNYYVFLAVNPASLGPNQHLSNHLLEPYGDAFVLKLVERERASLADFHHDVLAYLAHLRHYHLFPDYEDVKDEILQSGIVATVAGDLLKAAIERAKSSGEMVVDDDEDEDEDEDEEEEEDDDDQVGRLADGFWISIEVRCSLYRRDLAMESQLIRKYALLQRRVMNRYVDTLAL